jgi:hypothetical protein
MAIAKSQLEYKLVHNDYMQIRNNSLLGVINVLCFLVFD